MSDHQYKGHRAGSAKGRVHEVFDTKGKDAAIKKAVGLDIKETTARTWCSAWANGKGKKAAKKAPAKTAKKAKKAAAKKAPAKKAAPAKKTVKRETMEASA